MFAEVLSLTWALIVFTQIGVDWISCGSCGELWLHLNYSEEYLGPLQLTFTCLKSTIETLKKVVKYVQS